MDSRTLATQFEATALAGRLVQINGDVQVEVHEDRAFADDRWLSVGTVQSARAEDAAAALERGQYVWTLPTATTIASEIEGILGPCRSGNQSLSAEEMASRMGHAVREGLQDLARRLGLVHPVFDAGAVASWPYAHPTTLVVDTSAVIQGGLDFAVRFLYPMARIKVPAVVGVEVRNQADAFFAIRHHLDGKEEWTGKHVRCLSDHIKSQSAERALLRLELRSQAEVERPPQGTDPLRMVFTKDGDTVVKDLNLSSVQRSFADRLIFETAREHQSRLSPGQPVHVLTSDQGLARACLAEGMAPLYFDARKTGHALGQTLAGTLYHPLTSGLYTVSLADVLWELATAFGACRLRVGEEWVRVRAMAGDLTWSPYHADGDLLWVDASWAEVEEEDDDVPHTACPQQAPTAEPSPPAEPDAPTWAPGDDIVGYSVNAERLLRLIDGLGDREGATVSQPDVLSFLGVGSESAFKDYRLFLESGELAERAEGGLRPLPPLAEAAAALRAGDLDGLARVLLRVPSLRAFAEAARALGVGPEWESEIPMRKKVIPGYKALTEVCALGLTVGGERFCATPARPTVDEFVEMALASYRHLAETDDLVLTGAWLERLSCEHAVPPVVSRDLLAAALDRRLLAHAFEGSTPDHRSAFDAHTLYVLTDPDGAPAVRRYKLYDGTFLVPGVAAVRLRLSLP